MGRVCAQPAIGPIESGGESSDPLPTGERVKSKQSDGIEKWSGMIRSSTVEKTIKIVF